MISKESMKYLDDMVFNYPKLECVKSQIVKAVEMLIETFKDGGKLLICGNGGSAGDADHIVGELMKGFMMRRELNSEMRSKIVDSEYGQYLNDNLQLALPAINLASHNALITALCNDIGQDIIFAQQVLGYGKSGDVLFGISTSGNSMNIVYAGVVAKALGMKTLGMTGIRECKMDERFDVIIKVPSDVTPAIQDLHRPVYHCICEMVESEIILM